MRKKTFVSWQYFFSLFVTATFFAFVSCSNMQQEKRAEEDELTLREITVDMAKSIPWTGALEGDRLTAEIGTKDGISRGVALSPLSVLAGGEESDILPVYPFLKDFGSLDTTLLSDDVISVLDGFCAALSHGENADSFIASGCMYQLALFIRDMKLDLPEETPAENSAEKTADKTKKTDKPEDSDSDKEEKEPEKPKVTFFDSFFYGQPYATGTMYEVPVRFTGKERSADVLIFLVKEKSAWKIDELQILKSELANGGK
ncbi:MAG: hypothetical protein IJS09_06550 [Treponema sp.]|nr:hypothetical protein [Treponema sp.]